MRVKVTSRGGGMEYYGHNDGWDTGILEDGKPVIGFSDYPARRPGTVQKWWIVWKVVIHPETNFRFYDKTTQTYSFWNGKEWKFQTMSREEAEQHAESMTEFTVEWPPDISSEDEGYEEI